MILSLRPDMPVIDWLKFLFVLLGSTLLYGMLDLFAIELASYENLAFTLPAWTVALLTLLVYWCYCNTF